MDKEIKNLLLSDLCARLPYGVKCDINDNKPYTLSSISNDYDGTLIRFKELKDGFNMEVYLSEVKPYLFPLSSITEEQIEELEKLCTMYTPDDDYNPYAYQGIKVLYKHVLDDGYTFSSYFNMDVIDWLNKNHFDYRGLIEKGIAIDATNLNIY